MKKLVGLILVFVLTTVGLFNITPVSTKASEKSVESVVVQASAPDTLMVIQPLPGPKQSYKFYSTKANGALYRGYLSFLQEGWNGEYLYSGTLYRDPLPYPIP